MSPSTQQCKRNEQYNKTYVNIREERRKKNDIYEENTENEQVFDLKGVRTVKEIQVIKISSIE